MKVICINDTGKPECIPSSHWVKKGEKYTVLRASRSLMTSEIIIELEEIDLSSFAPYKGFKPDRFGLDIPSKESNEFADKLIEELEKEFYLVDINSNC